MKHPGRPCEVAGCQRATAGALTRCRQHLRSDVIAATGHLSDPEHPTFHPPARKGTLVVEEFFVAVTAEVTLRIAAEVHQGTSRVTISEVVPTKTSWTPRGLVLTLPPRTVAPVSAALFRLAQRL
jgi:hypothetical protein